MPTEVQIYKDGTIVGADIADETITAAKLDSTTASNGKGKRTVSTSLPSGGSDGDIWYVV